MSAIVYSLSQDYSFQLPDKNVSSLEGYVISETTGSEKTNSFVFRSLEGEKILIRTDKYSNFDFGDKISISGKIQSPQNFESENGVTFDYQKYLAKDGIFYSVMYPQIDILEKNSKRDLYYYIFAFKKFFVEKAQSIFSKGTSSLVLGILLGSKDSLDQTLKNNFQKTGLIHILVLSGFNLTIIIYFVFLILKPLHRSFRFLFSILFVLIFIIMVGSGATVVRSGIMIFLFVLAKILRRNSDAFNAILLAGSVMIFQNPMILIYDPSFQLSFVATLGLISFSKYIEKIMPFLPSKFGIKDIVVSNIAVQIAVIPLLIYLMGEFSVISLLPNILILPIIPFFMLISFVAIVFSFLSSFVALPFIFITEKISQLIIFVVNFFGQLSFATIKIKMHEPKILIGIFIFYFLVIIFLKIREKFISKRRYSYLQSSPN